MLNQCNFIGRLGRDPEIRTTQSGAKVANFSLAVSEKYKDKSGQKQEKTEWVNVVCWNEGLISVIESYLSKGTQVYISGKMQTRKWSDQSGNNKYTTEIVMQGFDSKLIMLGDGGAIKDGPDEGDRFADDIPF
jgi:single-strand DNA-binding protein